MSNSFPEQFKQMLGGLPGNYSLEEWQYLYRDVIFSMGLQILERFSSDAIGPNPFERGGNPAVTATGAATAAISRAPGSHGPGINPSPLPGGNHPNMDGSHGPGYSPSLVIAAIALGLQAPPEDS